MVYESGNEHASFDLPDPWALADREAIRSGPAINQYGAAIRGEFPAP